MPELYIKWNKVWTRLTGRVPSWLLVIISGMITQSMLSFMHRGDPKAGEKAKEGEKDIVVSDTAAIKETGPKVEATEKKAPIRVKSKKAK